MAPKDSGEKTYPLRDIVPDGYPLTFSNHFTVQPARETVIFTFFQVHIPAVGEEFGGELRAHCVSRIALGKGQAWAVLDALQENSQHWGPRPSE